MRLTRGARCILTCAHRASTIVHLRPRCPWHRAAAFPSSPRHWANCSCGEDPRLWTTGGNCCSRCFLGRAWNSSARRSLDADRGMARRPLRVGACSRTVRRSKLLHHGGDSRCGTCAPWAWRLVDRRSPGRLETSRYARSQAGRPDSPLGPIFTPLLRVSAASRGWPLRPR